MMEKRSFYISLKKENCMFEQLTKQTKGLLLMLIGFVFLMYSLGVFGKSFIVFLAAVCLMAVGFIMFGGVQKVQGILKKK